MVRKGYVKSVVMGDVGEEFASNPELAKAKGVQLIKQYQECEEEGEEGEEGEEEEGEEGRVGRVGRVGRGRGRRIKVRREKGGEESEECVCEGGRRREKVKRVKMGSEWTLRSIREGSEK